MWRQFSMPITVQDVWGQAAGSESKQNYWNNSNFDSSLPSHCSASMHENIFLLFIRSVDVANEIVEDVVREWMQLSFLNVFVIKMKRKKILKWNIFLQFREFFLFIRISCMSTNVINIVPTNSREEKKTLINLPDLRRRKKKSEKNHRHTSVRLDVGIFISPLVSLIDTY